MRAIRSFIPGEQVERSELLNENDRVFAEASVPATLREPAAGYHEGLAVDGFLSSRPLPSRRPRVS